jgi:hypothetical protein
MHNPFDCIGALKREVARQDREINTISDRLLAAEKELREKEWEKSKE